MEEDLGVEVAEEEKAVVGGQVQVQAQAQAQAQAQVQVHPEAPVVHLVLAEAVAIQETQG